MLSRVGERSSSSTAAKLFGSLRAPVIGAPMFIVSNPDLVIAQCKAGIVGSFPALNARPKEKSATPWTELDVWLTKISAELAAHTAAHPDRPAAPFAVNQIVHKSNVRLMHDLESCVRHRVPIVITSLGAREDVNAAIHSYGGIVLHDVTNVTHAKKALEKGADGLVAVAAGAGGHAGTCSPFALAHEIREFFDGPLALSGAIATGRGVLAARAAGADFAYIGSAFIATEEANASEAYKQAVVDSSSDDIVYSNLFTGVHGNYLKGSIVAQGLDPANLPQSDPSKMNFEEMSGGSKAWKDIWGAGQGVGAIKTVPSASEFAGRLVREFEEAAAELARRPHGRW